MSAINANARWVDNQHVVDYEIAFDREQELLSELAKAQAQQFTPSKLNTKYLQQIESLKSELATAQKFKEQFGYDNLVACLTALHGAGMGQSGPNTLLAMVKECVADRDSLRSQLNERAELVSEWQDTSHKAFAKVGEQEKQLSALQSELATAQAEEQRMRDDVCWFLTAEEQQAVKELCETQDLVPQGVLRQALRMYQQQVKGPLKLSMLPESDGMEGVLNTELERLTRQLQTAMEERDEARAKANLIALARDANQECYDKACEERDTANSRLEEAEKALRKCVVQLGYCKAGYHLGRKIDEAYDEATALLSRLSTYRETGRTS